MLNEEGKIMNTIAATKGFEKMTAEKNTLLDFVLHLADDALILAHRNSEWCGHGPVLEQDIALTNIALDLLGQARNFYQYAAVLKGDGATEDSFAYWRTENQFKNCLLVEQPNGDWGKTILRQYFFSSFQYFFLDHLRKSADEQLAAIAEKSLKEVRYHLKWSSEWVIRLGDGTEESKRRMMNGIDQLWMFTGELFEMTDYEKAAVESGVGVNLHLLKTDWTTHLVQTFSRALLPVPDAGAWMQSGGKVGRHTEYLGYILTELQYLQRTYPGCEW